MARNKEKKTQRPIALTVLVIVLALMVVAVGLIGYYSEGWQNWDRFIPDKGIQQPTEPGDTDGNITGGITDGDGNEMTPGEVYPMPANMVFATTAADNSSITLSATVKPEETSNKNLKWELQWVNASSEWANGKTVTDYITLSAGTGSTATVTCLQAFGEQAKIVVTAESNPEAQAECTLDYAQRLTGIEFSILNGPDGVIDFETNDLIPVEWKDTDEDVNGMELVCDKDTSDVYTLKDEYTVEVEVSMHMNMFATYVLALDNWLNVPDNSLTFHPEHNSKTITSYAEAFSREGLISWLGEENYNLITGSDSVSMISHFRNSYPHMVNFIKGVGEVPGEEKLASAVTKDFGGVDGFKERMGIEFTVSVSGEYGSATEKYTGYFDVANLEVLAESVELSKPSIVF